MVFPVLPYYDNIYPYMFTVYMVTMTTIAITWQLCTGYTKDALKH